MTDHYDVIVIGSGAGGGTLTHALAPALGLVIVMRALLGVGEAFNWPCALRVTGVILPPKDRTLGNGIFNSGAAIGAVLTPLTVPALAAWLGWRAAFTAIGLLGWIALLNRPPHRQAPNAGRLAAGFGRSWRTRAARSASAGSPD